MRQPTWIRDSGRLPLAFAAAAAACAGVVLAVGAPVAWLWLAVCVILTAPVVVWGIACRRFLEPLPILAAIVLLAFAVRPLQLMLGWRDLYSHFVAEHRIDELVHLEAHEIAFFVSTQLREPLAPAMARALGACALFLALLLVGYGLAGRLSLGRRLAGLGATTDRINVPIAVGASLLIGVAAQVALIARAGGPRGSIETASDQQALSDSFVLFVLAGFGMAALIVWAAWQRPRARLEWATLILAVVTVCGLWAVTGSRARVFAVVVALAIVVHYLWRRWRLREVAVAAALLLALGSSFVVFREVAEDRALSRAASVAGDHVFDPQVIINDISYFDHVLYATTIYGRLRRHERGEFLLNGARSYVPGKIDPSKPEGGDIEFRRVVWGRFYGAGRPPTAVGDLYIDFGFPGVAVGGLLVGAAARALLGLLGGSAGRRYRVALYAILLLVLYEFVVGTFSIALGLAFTLLAPFLATVHGLGRIPRPPAVAARTAAE